MDEWRNIPDNLGDKPTRNVASIKSQLLITAGLVFIIFIAFIISKLMK